MDYRWRYQDENGREIAGPADRFPTQADAEEWFSQRWPDLHDSGVAQVTLLHGEAEVYGPMSLDPAG